MKLLAKYQVLKQEDSKKNYLFKVGNFYIFISDDAKKISEVTTLKLSFLGEVEKCGFPLKSLDKYLLIFENIGLEVVVIENKEDIVEEITALDLNVLTKEELICLVTRFKKSL